MLFSQNQKINQIPVMIISNDVTCLNKLIPQQTVKDSKFCFVDPIFFPKTQICLSRPALGLCLAFVNID